MKKIGWIFFSLLTSLGLIASVLQVSGFAGSFNVKGILRVSSIPVSSAKITFTDIHDTASKYTAFTDTLGYFSLSISTGVDNEQNLTPLKFSSAINYPNPFSEKTSISYNLNGQSAVCITIYNILGQKVRTINSGFQNSGRHAAIWDGRNDQNQSIPCGIYLYQIISNNEKFAGKMLYTHENTGLPAAQFSASGINIPQKSITKYNSTAINPGSYNIRIENTRQTIPRIEPFSTENLMISRDTSLNYSLEKEKFPYAVCYSKVIDCKGKIYLNSLDGTNLVSIPSTSSDDYPQWSSDGKYILYAHSSYNICLYDIENKTTTELTPGGGHSAFLPKWTPDGKKVYFMYRQFSTEQTEYAYIIKADGTGLKKIADCSTKDIHFCNDSYHFIYAKYTDKSGTKIIRTDIDNIKTDTVFCSPLSTGIYLYDFNPDKNDALIRISAKDSLELILSYNIDSRLADTLMELNFSGKIQYNNDYSGFIMSYTDYQENRISSYKNGDRKDLVCFPHDKQWFHWSDMHYSPKGKFLTYVKDVQEPGFSFWWRSYIYNVEPETGLIHYYDEGCDPVWNPLLPY